MDILRSAKDLLEYLWKKREEGGKRGEKLKKKKEKRKRKKGRLVLRLELVTGVGELGPNFFDPKL